MNRVELTARLQSHFNDNTYYSTQDFNESIQDGIDEVTAFSGCRYATGLIDFQANLTYYDMVSLLPDYIGVVSIFNKVTNRWLIPTSLKKLEAVRSDWDCAVGSVEYFVPISFRYIAISKKPVTVGGQMLVFYRATALTLSDEQPIQIPEEHILTLESYVKTDLAEQNQEWGKANLNFQEYLATLEHLRVAVRNQINRDRYLSLKGA